MIHCFLFFREIVQYRVLKSVATSIRSPVSVFHPNPVLRLINNIKVFLCWCTYLIIYLLLTFNQLYFSCWMYLLYKHIKPCHMGLDHVKYHCLIMIIYICLFITELFDWSHHMSIIKIKIFFSVLLLIYLMIKYGCTCIC